jgi:Flp pilus assembly protein TadG
VTAETALALPSVVVAVALVTCVGQVVGGQLRCVDAARAAARAAARGEAADQVTAVAELAGPAGAQVELSRSGEQVEVRVRAQVQLSLPGQPEIDVTALASALSESSGGSTGAGG